MKTFGIFKESSEDRQVVCQRLAGGGTGGEDDVLSCAGVIPGFELVGVKGMDSGSEQGLFNGSRQVIREGMRLCGARWERLPGDKIGRGVCVTFPEIQKRGEGHR